MASKRRYTRDLGPELEALVTFTAPHKSAMNPFYFCRLISVVLDGTRDTTAASNDEFSGSAGWSEAEARAARWNDNGGAAFYCFY